MAIRSLPCRTAKWVEYLCPKSCIYTRVLQWLKNRKQQLTPGFKCLFFSILKETYHKSYLSVEDIDNQINTFHNHKPKWKQFKLIYCLHRNTHCHLANCHAAVLFTEQVPESTSARFVTILKSGDCIQTTRWRGGSLILFVLVYICMKREGGSDYVVVKFTVMMLLLLLIYFRNIVLRYGYAKY